jgi:site-specific DNA-methyltransferase (adenine-specific)
MLLPITDIIIKPERQRQNFDPRKLEELTESFRSVGQLQPVIIDEDNILIAGERRIKAAQMLGRTEIWAEYLTNLEPWQKDVAELEENLRREGLSYVEEVMAVKKIHQLHQDKFGVAMSGPGKQGWNVKATAELLGISTGSVSQDIQLASAIEKDPELGKQKTKIAAKSMLGRKNAIKTRQILALLANAKDEKSTSKATSPSSKPASPLTFLHGDARELVSSIPDDSISCLLTDPPWQVEFDAEFGSDIKTGLDLTKEVLKLVYPKLQVGSLCWMFCATKHLIRGTIFNLLVDCGYRPYDQVLIWYKPSVAHSSHPYRELKNDYEPAVFFSKSEPRDLLKPMFAVQTFKVLGQKLHPAQKPFELLKLLIENSTVGGETVLDPFMGSGETLRAARETGRKGIGIEKELEWFNLASSV